MESHPGDVYVIGFQCSGCDWLKGIVEKLQHKRCQIVSPANGFHNMLRTLNCVGICPEDMPFKLVSFDQLPCKFIVLLRHPKDIVIAQLLRAGYDPAKHIQDFLQTVYPGEEPSWFNHTLKWESFFRNFNEETVHLVLYKDLTQNLYHEVTRMASFLGLPQDRLQTDNFYRDLDLESILSPEEPKRKRQRTDLGERLASFNATEYENGVWKKFFTMAQSEVFDADITHRLQNVSHHTDVQWIRLAME